MTKYSVSVYANGEWESIALFSDKVSVGTMVDFCLSHADVMEYTQDYAISDIALTDMTTGEVLWNLADDDRDDYNDDVDESNYDPYLGCDSYDCEPFDGGW